MFEKHFCRRALDIAGVLFVLAVFLAAFSGAGAAPAQGEKRFAVIVDAGSSGETLYFFIQEARLFIHPGFNSLKKKLLLINTFNQYQIDVINVIKIYYFVLRNLYLALCFFFNY